jgi:hypothetical protein
MSIVKLNNRSVKDITAFGSISSLGSLSHIATQTASSSASLSFTSGIDSTYKEYIFYFVNMHPATDGAFFTFQSDTGTNTNYNQTITSTHFQARHDEGDSDTSLAYNTGNDQAQGTSFHKLSNTIGNDNDQSLSGFCHVFNPSSSVFVKHFISNIQHSQDANFSFNVYTAGYFNTTTAITRFQFKMSSGNIDSGQILLFGLN